jgi:hypothetical protein
MFYFIAIGVIVIPIIAIEVFIEVPIVVLFIILRDVLILSLLIIDFVVVTHAMRHRLMGSVLLLKKTKKSCSNGRVG